MRYHYQRGATKPKKGFGRVKLGIAAFLMIAIIGYGSFLAVLPGFGGWPLRRGDETAQYVRTTAPTQQANQLYIPKLNVMAAIGPGYVDVEGELGNGKVAMLRADKLRLALTPQATLEQSPFSRLSQLKKGDEFFVDYNGVRYAYAVTNDSHADLQLQTTDMSVTVKAKPIGIVAWNGGSPRIEVAN
jgi:hypothetical protein